MITTAFVGDYPMTSPYGWRTIGGTKEFHNGVDFGLPIGTPLLSAISGNLENKVFNVLDPGGKPTQQLESWITNESVRTKQLHCSEFLVDGSVPFGLQIALSGNSGRSTGPHLHDEWQIKIINRWTSIDPLPFIQPNMDYSKPLNDLISQVNGVFQELRARRFQTVKFPTNAEFKGHLVQTGVIVNGQKIGARFSKDQGKTWSKAKGIGFTGKDEALSNTWFIDGDTYGDVLSTQTADVLTQYCTGTDGSINFRATTDGEKWSKWTLLFNI